MLDRFKEMQKRCDAVKDMKGTQEERWRAIRERNEHVGTDVYDLLWSLEVALKALGVIRDGQT